ncbi:MAG: hypothetical protein AAF561_03335 [Planctomycetota bacterium]
MRLAPVSAKAARARAVPTDAEVEKLGRTLRKSLQKLLDDVCDGPPAEHVLVDRLGLDRSSVGRVLRALREPSTHAFLAGLPSPEGLTLVAEASSGLGAATTDVERATALFADLIHRHPGKRRGLNARLAAGAPSARERADRDARRAMSKAAAEMVGFRARRIDATLFVLPTGDPKRFDGAYLSAKWGVELLRPNGPSVSVGSVRPGPAAPRLDYGPLDATAPADDPSSCLLRDHCRAANRATRLEFVEHGPDGVELRLPASEPEVGDSVDVVWGQRIRHSLLRRQTPKTQFEWLSTLVTIPTDRVVINLLLPPEVWPDVDPVAAIRFHRSQPPVPPTHDRGALPGDLATDFLETSTSDGLNDDEPLLCDAANRLGLVPSQLRRWRFEWAFPVLNSELTIWLPLPDDR